MRAEYSGVAAGPVRRAFEALTRAHNRLAGRVSALEYDGAWDGKPLRLGAYHLWVDATGDLRIKNSAPTSDTDGTVVGTQT